MIQLDKLREALLNEIKLPDVKGRHLFIARLRLMIFILCWVLFAVFYSEIWIKIPLISLIFNVGFLVTAICYWNILHEKRILSMAGLEILADLVSQTTIIYILGPDSTAVFLMYGFYIMGAGVFFGFRVALLASILALLLYWALILSMQMGFLHPFVYPAMESKILSLKGFGYLFNLLLLPIVLAILIYATRIAHYFTTIKERALELKNIQLLALNKIGSVIRSTVNFKSVTDQVLQGVIQGLGFDTCFLALLDESKSLSLFYFPKENPYSHFFKKMFEEATLPQTATENAINKVLSTNKAIIRNDFVEICKGLEPAVASDKILKLQKDLFIKKFVIAPLVAENRVIGALIGASRKEFVEDTVLENLDHFANQAALALESSELFERIKEKNKELEKLNRVKSEFLAMMSHELRTPLNAIMGYSETLIDESIGKLNDEQKKALREVYKSANHLLNDINNILDLAKLESGKMELSKEVFSLSDVIEDIKRTVLPLLTKKNLIFKNSVDEKLPLIEADSRKIRQILLNLVGNSIKFTPEKGLIEISASFISGEQAIKSFGLKETFSFKNGNCFLISVKDTGIGIKAENLPTIFDSFRQVDSRFTRQYQGTGLGLSLCKQLVELHHGVIAVTSTYGKGSEFKFLIPKM